MKLPLTAVILSYNEERDIGSCIQSLQDYVDDVVVLDSGSRDRTVEIAGQLGARLYTNAFTGFGDQRNWAIDNVEHKHDWVIHLDADERLTSELAKELGSRLASDPTEAGYYVPCKLMFGNRWLRYSGGFPTYQVRVFHRKRLRFVNDGHGQREVTQGKLAYVNEPYLHYGFSKGIECWFLKHVQYSAKEAVSSLQDEPITAVEFTRVFFGDRVSRRRSLKRLSRRVPFRRILRIIDLLILKRGILDGWSGILYARMLAVYEEMIAIQSAYNRTVRSQD